MNNLVEFKSKLEKKIKDNKQIFIIPHIGVDLDAIASSIAMYYIAKKYGKETHIIIDEDSMKIEPGVKMIVEEVTNNISIINMSKYKLMNSDKDLLVACDVSKTNLVACRNNLENFNE